MSVDQLTVAPADNSGGTMHEHDSAIFRTSAFTPHGSSAIDPLVEEVTWFAFELASADPNALSDSSVRGINVAFDCLVEAAWQPGRSVIISEVDWNPDRDDHPFSARLAVGVLGAAGSTGLEAHGLVARVERTITAWSVFTGAAIDPVVVVPGCQPDNPSTISERVGNHAAHVRQVCVTVGDEVDVIDIVSRFSTTVDPWSGVVGQLTHLRMPVRVRATVLATELSPADRLEIENALTRTQRLRERNSEHPEIIFDAQRAEATLLDLRASLSTPALVAEIAICSPHALAESLLRSLASSFTSQTDVLRRQGHIVVAANRLYLGGFELRHDPPGWQEAQMTGIPLRGGTGARSLVDLITLTESPIGWPLPVRTGLPSIPRGGGIEMPVPAELDPTRNPEPSTVIGRTPRGHEVGMPIRHRDRHLVASGSWGAGKTTLLFELALDDLRHHRQLVWIDPHGDAADRIADFAVDLDVPTVIIDPNDGNTDRIQALPAAKPAKKAAYKADLTIRRLSDAIARSLPDVRWAGPRWFAGFNALLELTMVHNAELVDGATWLTDHGTLQAKLTHPQLSRLARSTLQGLIRDQDDVGGWITSKLHPLVSGATRRVIAPTGQGIDLAEAVRDGWSIIVNLAGLSNAEASLVGHIVLATVLDAAMSRPIDRRDLVTCYVDEVHRFPAQGLATAVAEGRKFGLGLAIACQSLGQLPAEVADLVMAAGTHAIFRATPDTAARLSASFGMQPSTLIAQPDLQATLLLKGQPPTTVVLPPYSDPPGARKKTPPKWIAPHTGV